MMRREFIAAICSAAVARPIVALGQQTGKVYRVGLISAAAPVLDIAGPEPAHPPTLFVSWSPPAFADRAHIVDFATRTRLPSNFAYREPVELGGLMSYGVNVADLFRRAAGYVAKILQGAKPADLPVDRPTKFEFVINLKTAKALGLQVPPTLLAAADEVIE
jgi:ABC transporter substrate binding protein